MKPIIKVLLFITDVVLLSQCEKDEPEPDTKVTISDDNFLIALIERGVDTNGDSIISSTEAEIINFLNISNSDISDINGIEKFINLDTLLCENNQLTTIDISNNTVLKGFACSGNPLSDFDHIFNHTILELLACDSCQLGTLDVSNLTALNILSCNGNQLTALDITKNTALTWLECEGNQLTILDVSNQPGLLILYCGGNQLTSLDISNNTQLGVGFENSANYFLSIHDMPSLQKVCVWIMPFPPDGFHLYMYNSPNVNFTTDCSK